MSRSTSTTFFGTILFALVLALALGGCSGGGSPFQPQGPSDLSYADFPASYGRGVLANPALPSLQGEATLWSIAPALPAGLEFDTATGVISGRPTELAERASYHVEAAGPMGSTSTDVVLEVVEPTNFAVSGNVQDDTLSVFVVNPQNGIQRLWSYTKAPVGESYPIHVAPHPSGSPVYVVNRQTDNVSIYDLDSTQGRLTPRAPVATGARPTFLTVNPDATAAYVALSQTGYVQAYSIDPNDGGLTPLGLPLFSGAGVERLSVRPDGRFLVASNAAADSLRLFAIDPVDGSLTQKDEVAAGAGPRAMIWSSDGRWLFVTDTSGGTVSTFSSKPKTGALELRSQLAVGALPSSLAIDPFDRHLHVAITGANLLRTLAIDLADGSLFEDTVPMFTGELPTVVQLNSTGKRLFVVDTTSREVAVFTVDPVTGQPTGRESSRSREMPLGFALIATGEPASPQPQFAYVTNRGSDSVSMFKSVGGQGKLTEIAPDLNTPDAPRGLASDPFARHVYAVTGGSNQLSSYAISPLDGELLEIGAPLATGGNPHSVVVDYSARFLYVSNPASSEVSMYDLDLGNGTPAAKGTLGLGRQPTGMVIEPTGRFLYTANQGVNGISVLRIDPVSGVLSAQVSEKLTNATPGALEVHPTGRYLYAAFAATGELRQYEIDSTNGSLKYYATVVSGVQPTSFTIDPRGRWGFATNFDALGTGDLSIFSIDMTSGLPTLVGTHAAGLHPVDALVGPSGRYLFVVNQGSDDVHVFRIKTGDGNLTLEDTIATGVSPERIVVTGTFSD